MVPRDLAQPRPDGAASLAADSSQRPFGHFEKVRKLFKRPGQTPLVAIDTVSFDLHAGQLISLLGPSGCGKTTFLRIAAGLIAKTNGIVEINGAEVEIGYGQAHFGAVQILPSILAWVAGKANAERLTGTSAIL